MTFWSCATCGIEHPDSPAPPRSCAICSDERQRVPPTGQRWTTQEELAAQGCVLRVSELEPGLHAVEVSQRVGIGHRPLLVRTSGGNLLWDPPGYLDEAGVRAVRELGGAAVIASSHPHLTGASIRWSHALGRAPVLVAEADAAWVRRPDPVVGLWSGATEVLPGVTLVPCGGHFAGSAVAHWAAGADGRGALLTGDTIMIGGDLASVSVMRSYVNDIPLPERAVRRILAALEPYRYDRLHGGFSTLEAGAREIVQATLERYVAWLRGDVDEDVHGREPGAALSRHSPEDDARARSSAAVDGHLAEQRPLAALRRRVLGTDGEASHDDDHCSTISAVERHGTGERPGPRRTMGE